MIFLCRDGRIAVADHADHIYVDGDSIPISAACGFVGEEAPETGDLAPFGYYFADAGYVPHIPGKTGALDRLASEMVSLNGGPCKNSHLPAVFAFFAEFIDHDINAAADCEPGLSIIDVEDIEPVDRQRIPAGLRNLHFGTLTLESVYGGGPAQGSFARRMTAALRFPWDRAKLWAGTDFDAGAGSMPLPEDPARDLLRLGRITHGDGAPFTPEEIFALPEPLRALFVREGELRRQRAIVGDFRNESNLALAQLHLAFVRFHNRVADTGHLFGAPYDDREALHLWCRQQVTWIYQWLIVNIFLPAICDPAVFAETLAARAPVYAAFHAANRPRRGRNLPVPLEFSAAAFLFRHSMVRPSFDWNPTFGVPGTCAFPGRASLDLLFQLTGGAHEPLCLPGERPAPRLPSHCLADWERFAGPPPEAHRDRAALRIDTALALPLGNLPNEPPNRHPALRHLARSVLRRGYRLNIPSAQECIRALSNRFGISIAPLSRSDLVGGPVGDAMADGGFLDHTPLWPYVLREAEIIDNGRLGPLGSRLVAETLLGLIMNDPGSYWRQFGSDADRRWQPEDGCQPGGEPVRSLPALLRAAGVM